MKMKGLRFAQVDLSLILPIFLSLYLFFSLVSISIGQIFISLSFLCWLILLLQGKQNFGVPSFFWPLFVYALLSLAASFLSVNPEMSLKDSRELLLFLIIPLIYTGFRGEWELRRASLAFLASAGASVFYSLYYFLFKAAPAERITGFMGHYMTQAGLLVLFISTALVMVFFSRDKTRILWGILIPFSLLVLALTLTRSAWVGVVVAAAAILILYRPLTVIVLPVLIGLFFILSPAYMQKRVVSIFGLKNYWNIQRLEYLKAGLKIIKDYPLWGTGPDTVDMVFQNPKYRLSEEAKRNVHLHSNLIQIGAERGIPALLAWLSFMVWAFLALTGLLKNKDPAVFSSAAAGLACLLALATAGLFEYNFGDSEISTLFLCLLTLPFALDRIKKSEITLESPV